MQRLHTVEHAAAFSGEQLRLFGAAGRDDQIVVELHQASPVFGVFVERGGHDDIVEEAEVHQLPFQRAGLVEEVAVLVENGVVESEEARSGGEGEPLGNRPAHFMFFQSAHAGLGPVAVFRTAFSPLNSSLLRRTSYEN